MLRHKLLNVAIATTLAIGLPLSVAPQVFAPGVREAEVNGISLNGTQSNGMTLTDSTAQSLRVEGGQLVIQADMSC